MQLEAVLGPGYELVHTHRMGWLLRRWDTWTVQRDHPEGEPRMGWAEVDSAPDGQLGALLLRHQQRTRKNAPDRLVGGQDRAAAAG